MVRNRDATADSRAARVALAVAASLPVPGREQPAAVASAAQRQGIAAETMRGAQQLGWAELADLLQPDHRSLTIRGLHLVASTNRLIEQLRAAGVPSLCMKGVAVAAQTRRDVLARPATDVDLLVEPSTVAEAHAALLAAGARLAPRFLDPDNSRGYRQYLRLRHEATYQIQRTKLDLHWHLGPERALLASTEDAFARSVTVSVQGIDVPTLCPQDALVHAALHWRGYGYRKLKYVLDLQGLWQLVPDASGLPPVVRRDIAVAAAMLSSDGDWHPEDPSMRNDRGYRRAVAAIEAPAPTYPPDLRQRVTSLRDQIALASSPRLLPESVAAAAVGPLLRGYRRVRVRPTATQ